MYRQCRLERKTENGVCCQVSWIPVPYCVKGKVLKLRSNGIWENGWEVISASDRALSSPPYYGHMMYTTDLKHK